MTAMTDEPGIAVDAGFLSTLNVTPADAPEHSVPNHRASRDEPTVDTGTNTTAKRTRPGIFGANQRQSTKRPKTLTAAPPYKKGEYTELIGGAYEFIGTAIKPFDPHCGQVIVEAADKAAEAWDAAAENSPRLRKFLKWATTGGAWSAVVIANAPIIYAVATHHTPIVEATQRRMMTFMAQRMADKETE